MVLSYPKVADHPIYRDSMYLMPHFSSFMQQNLEKTWKKEVLTSVWSVPDPNAGQNTQRLCNCVLTFKHYFSIVLDHNNSVIPKKCKIKKK